LPKCLVPVGGRPLLDYWIDRLAAAGVTEAVVNTHSHPELVRAFIRQVNRSGRLRLSEFHEPHLLGSAGTLAANPAFADDADDVLVVAADNFTNADLSPLLAYHRGHGDALTMLLYRAANPRACGIAECDPEGRVVGFVEKPAEPRSDLASGALYALTPAGYREMASAGGHDIGFDVLPRFVGRMRGWLCRDYYLDVGTTRTLQKARRDAAHLPPGPRLTGPLRPAAFLDRDGTLIEDAHHLTRPEQVRLLPGAAAAVRRLRAAGFACVLVTNQSVVGRGMLTEEGLWDVHDELNRQLALEGAALDATYYCPLAPAGPDRSRVEHPDRKPGSGMLLRAAADLGLDLGASWMVGDMPSDTLAGRNAGCRGSILVRTGRDRHEARLGDAEAADLAAATDIILARGAGIASCTQERDCA
jgi:histidinol-phosphate phosphatase family protein